MNRGFALLGALIITLVLAILGTGVVVFVSRNSQNTISYTTGTRSFYALQAGIEFAERKLRITGENIPIGTLAGTYEFGNTAFTISSGGSSSGWGQLNTHSTGSP